MGFNYFLQKYSNITLKNNFHPIGFNKFMDFAKIPSPCFVLDEKRLRQNLARLQFIQQHTGIQILIALKGFALWPVFPLIRQSLSGAAASSCYEARLCFEEMKTHAHTYCVSYNPDDFSKIMHFSSHLIFNSLFEFQRFHPSVEGCTTHKISCGLRIHPEFSVVAEAPYDPSRRGSRFGVDLAQLPSTLPAGIEGIHVHCLCDSPVEASEALLNHLEMVLSPYLPQLKWLNLGGGHLLTQADYPLERFNQIIRRFTQKYPHIQLILELGTAIVWQVGVLVATVLDIVDKHGTKTLMTNISFAAHLPDALLPFQHAEIEGASRDPGEGDFVYQIGGNSCQANDYLLAYYFHKPVQIGDTLIFKNAIPYTLVKSTFFNGLAHPAIGIWSEHERFRLLKEYNYQDFKASLG